jgi:hypothetical protein
MTKVARLLSAAKSDALEKALAAKWPNLMWRFDQMRGVQRDADVC